MDRHLSDKIFYPDITSMQDDREEISLNLIKPPVFTHQAKNLSTRNGQLDRSLLNFIRKNILLEIILIISVLSIYNFWCTYNYWSLIRYRNIIEPNSRAFRIFKNVPMENMKLCITIFNYTNIQEYNKNNSVPFKIESVGPFCFRDVSSKKNLAFNEDFTLISYQEDSKTTFLPDKSNGTLDDIVYVPNIPLFSIIHRVLEHNVLVRWYMLGTRFKLNTNEPFVALKVSEFLFGYSDELLESIYDLGQKVGFQSPRTFSLLDNIMGNINSRYTLDTGKSNISNLGNMIVYNDKTKLNVWKTDECNQFKGSCGAYWSPDDVRNAQNVSFFNGFLCRNVPLMKEKDIKYANFITVARYQSATDMFLFPEDGKDSCYCVEEPCVSNLFSLTKCLAGPFVLSYKNFFGVDKKHLSHLNLENIQNFTQTDEDWKTYFDIHPGLGNTMSYRTTFQMNLQVRTKATLSEFPINLEQGLILPAVVIERMGPHLNTKTTILLITLSVVEGTFQYGSIILSILIIFILIRRKINYNKDILVHTVTVSSPTIYQHAQCELKMHR